jgi:hypothetical protein
MGHGALCDLRLCLFSKGMSDGWDGNFNNKSGKLAHATRGWRVGRLADFCELSCWVRLPGMGGADTAAAGFAPGLMHQAG